MTTEDKLAKLPYDYFIASFLKILELHEKQHHALLLAFKKYINTELRILFTFSHYPVLSIN